MITPQPQYRRTGEIDVLRLDITVPMDQVPAVMASLVSAFLSSCGADGPQTLAQVPAARFRDAVHHPVESPAAVGQAHTPMRYGVLLDDMDRRSQYSHVVSVDKGTRKEVRRELAVRTSIAVLTAGAGLLGPDAGATATALTPALETVLARVVGSVTRWRAHHAAETLEDAAEAAGEPVELLVQEAVSDERRGELLARTLTIAQDTALRDKRRALGRALAAGIKGDDAKIDEELLFIRAVADIDTPHIKLLSLMAAQYIPPGKDSGSVFHSGWSLPKITARAPELGEAVPALLSTLESHGLVRAMQSSTPWTAAQAAYSVTSAGRFLLERLAAESLEPDAGTELSP